MMMMLMIMDSHGYPEEYLIDVIIIMHVEGNL